MILNTNNEIALVKIHCWQLFAEIFAIYILKSKTIKYQFRAKQYPGTALPCVNAAIIAGIETTIGDYWQRECKGPYEIPGL